jgi:xylulokinase
MIPAVVLEDRAGRPLRKVILQNDARAAEDIAALREQLADVDLVATTGSQLTQQSVAPTWRWLARHEAATCRSAAAVVGGAEHLAVALGARPHLEWNWALESGLYDLIGNGLAAVLAACRLDPALLPPVVRCGDVIGEVSVAAAGAVGLRPGTPIVAGGADHVLSAAAAGVAGPGDALVKLGGAGDLLLFSDLPVLDQRLYLDAHPLHDRWLPNGCMATSGSLLRWVQALIGGTDLATLDAAAAGVQPGEVLCLPHLLGEKSPIHDPDLRGAFIGLQLGHGPAHLHRAGLEAVAFGFRWMLDVAADVGLRPTRTLVANGGSSSTLWKRIIADATGNELHPVVDHPGAAYGAALAAAIGTGLLPGWVEAAELARTATPIEPDTGSTLLYDEAYASWHEALAALTPISHQLATRSTR